MTTTTSHSTASRSLSERIADAIADMIRTEGLAPGDPLHSARSLAAEFEVTVPTVREALRRLEAVEVIQFRHGSGTYVGGGVRRRLLANPHTGGDLASVLELVDARLLIEPGIAAAAAANRNDEQLAALEATTQNALVPQRGNERPREHFHVALAAASGNALVCDTLAALLDVRSRDQVEIRRRYHDRERDHEEHIEIFRAVSEQDAAAAAELTRTHLAAIRDTVITLGEELG
ncbi:MULTISPECIES: FadR/GntR family transcriptional regulator [unclassified Nocardioides]|uniref:FadR/GntR family transcriptional regulator n=1 Tax=unclassified Nocardioides TaxID=2615069 RepID=UPI000AF8F6C6|nr:MULTISPECIES: GntR family transcriptional regulator [unclassified Nocardioides]